MQSSAPQRHLPIRKDWLAATQEPALEPDRPIIDPHHHLWDHPGSRYLLDELLADVNSGHNIVATVFIQCGSGYCTTGPEETTLMPCSRISMMSSRASKIRSSVIAVCRTASGRRS